MPTASPMPAPISVLRSRRDPLRTRTSRIRERSIATWPFPVSKDSASGESDTKAPLVARPVVSLTSILAPAESPSCPKTPRSAAATTRQRARTMWSDFAYTLLSAPKRRSARSMVDTWPICLRLPGPIRNISCPARFPRGSGPVYGMASLPRFCFGSVCLLKEFVFTRRTTRDEFTISDFSLELARGRHILKLAPLFKAQRTDGRLTVVRNLTKYGWLLVL